MAQQGGTCLFLEDKYCYYTNKSGMVRENSCQLWKQLKQRAKNMMNYSSQWGPLDSLLLWMGALLGSLMGLLTILLLSPCMSHILTCFLTEHIQVIYYQLFLNVTLFLSDP